jgi:oxalate decarboxylase/phosphoglucose isomerase-like protein (cupin superfamily)
LIERGDTHEIKNTGREKLVTLNFYVPPAYTSDGEKLPAAKGLIGSRRDASPQDG